MLVNDNRLAVASLARETNPRAKAIERAQAETQAIVHQQEKTRLTRELQAIAVLRKERIANSKIGERRRLTTFAVVMAIVFSGAGYAVGHATRRQVQLHVIEHEPSGTGPVPVAVANGADATKSAVIPVPSMASEASQSPTITVSVSPSLADAAGQRQSIAVAPSAPPIASVGIAATLGPPRPVIPLPVRLIPAAKATDLTTSSPIKQAQVPNLPVVKTPEDQDIVLRVKPSNAASTPSASLTSTGSILNVATPPVGPAPIQKQEVPTTADFKVVNVIEGTVVVRQGQSVRQVKIGEKMPDGQTLRSVNVDKGQFETTPAK